MILQFLDMKVGFRGLPNLQNVPSARYDPQTSRGRPKMILQFLGLKVGFRNKF